MPTGMLDLEIGHFIRFTGSNVPDGFKDKFYRIELREPLAYVTGDEDSAIYSEVASGAESGYKNISILEPDDSPTHLYGVDWGIEDGAKYKIRIPTGTSRLGLDEDEDIGYIRAEMSPRYNPNPLYGFWIVADMYPAINMINDTVVASTPKIWFYGYKYLFKPVTDRGALDRLNRFLLGSGGQTFKYVTLGGVP